MLKGQKKTWQFYLNEDMIVEVTGTHGNNKRVLKYIQRPKRYDPKRYECQKCYGLFHFFIFA